MRFRARAQDFIPRTICSIGDEGGDGDGGGGGDDKDDGDKGGGIDDAKLNGALDNRFSRFRKSFEKDVQGAIQGAIGPIADQLKVLAEAKTKVEDTDASTKAGQQANDELKKALARIEELEGKNRDAEERATQTEAKRLRSEERTALTEALVQAGVDKSRMRAAVALIYGEDQAVGRDDDKRIVFKIPKAGYTDEVTLEEGISHWLKTDEGKAFLPAKGSAGSGAAGSNHQRSGRPNTKEERLAEARRTLAAASGINIQE